MGLFNNFPWTNFHELNLDWIVKQVKEIQAAFPEGLVGIPKGGTGADNAADARANLGIYASEIDMAPDDSRVISLVMGYLEDQIGEINYRIFKTVQDLGLTPGSVSIASTWTAMSSGDVVLCPPDEFSPGACPESYGTLMMIRSGGNSGCCLFFGATHQYRINYISNYPTGTWEQIYTDADIVPITNGGTGADNAADAIQNLGIDFSGTVLSVAGVGADPTGNVPLQVSDLIYKSITDLGIAAGSTLNAVWNSLSDDAVLIAPSSEIDNPPGDGTIFIYKGNTSTPGRIEFWAEEQSTGDAQMYLTSSGVPTNTWTRYFKILNFEYVALSGNQTIGPDQDLILTGTYTEIPGAVGYIPVLARMQYSVPRFNPTLENGNITVTATNIGSNSHTPALGFYIMAYGV